MQGTGLRMDPLLVLLKIPYCKNGRELCRERAKRCAETEDDCGLEIVFIIEKRSESLLEINFLFLVSSTTNQRSLFDDKIIVFAEKRAFEWAVREVELCNDCENKSKSPL